MLVRLHDHPNRKLVCIIWYVFNVYNIHIYVYIFLNLYTHIEFYIHIDFGTMDPKQGEAPPHPPRSLQKEFYFLRVEKRPWEAHGEDSVLGVQRFQRCCPVWALDMLDLVGYSSMRLLSDKYYGKVNAVVADGMRTPTLNELRRFDREMQVHVYRHLSRGRAIQYYVSTDADNLWRLLDPVIKQLPDQGVEAASAESKKDGNKRKVEEVDPSGGGGKVSKSPEPPRLKLCLVCHKRHEPLCKLPPNFRKDQREAQKKARAAKRAAKNPEKGDKAK